MSTFRALEEDQLAEISTGESRLISRRAVVRTGVTAAWSVPLIQVVGAAPALAVSGAKVEVLGGSATWDGNYIVVLVPLKNGGSVSLEEVTVTLTFSPNLAPEPNDGPNGRWTKGSVSKSGGKVSITFTTTRARLAAGSLNTLEFRVKDNAHKGTAGSVSVAVVASTGAVASGFITIPAATGKG
jgi:hypothetical protein